jgi:CelD/BcsL family acetyltransferase involved in cellulose biosynthesis
LATETSGSLEEYRAGLSSKVRSEIGRLRRKAEREHHLTLAPLATPYDLDAQLTRAFAVEASGWKGRAGTAISSSAMTEQFHRQIARNFHSAGALRISELSLDGTLAAMAITIIHQRRAFTIKVGYDERHRPLGPGLVLLMAMIERCFDLGLDAYEFSGPDAEYERRFATTHQRYHRLRIYRPGPLNAARYGYYRRIRPVLRFGYHRLRNRVPHPARTNPAN